MGSTPPLESHTARWAISTMVIMAYPNFQISLSVGFDATQGHPRSGGFETFSDSSPRS